MEGQWSNWSSFGSCTCESPGLRGLRIASRTCSNPKPQNGGRDCLGPSKKYKICQSSFTCEKSLSEKMEQFCQVASLKDPGILPFGDARD